MPQFEDVQQKLAALRAAYAADRLVLFQTTEQLAQVNARLAELTRQSRGENDRTAAERRALEQKKRALEQTKQQVTGKFADTAGELAGTSRVFEDWTDPREHAGRMHEIGRASCRERVV